MPDYFDCLRCGEVTELVTPLPACGKCGGRTGVIAKGREGAVVRPAPQENNANDNSAKRDTGLNG